MTVSVWFSNPAERTYRTWFLCSDCGFHTRAQHSGMPSHFAEERRRQDLDGLDCDILKKAILKRPY